MRTFGYLFILVGIIAIRQVMVGRVKDTPEDVKDFALALLSGDMSTVAEVSSRRGENVSVDGGDVEAGEPSTDTPSVTGGGSTPLITEMRKLGEATKTSSSPNGKYVWGATGPNSYDCSGIVWRAAKNIGLYTGSRFTTSTFESIANGWAKRVQAPSTVIAGDIVLWAGKHMGVVTGPDTYYSARSPAKGIGEASLSEDTSYFKTTPSYWRVSA